MSKTRSTDLGATPTRIGRYEVRARLGSGGFAVVYEAYDPSLDALVALKLFDAPDEVHDLARERFITEAQLLRRVDDPHVVTVFDVGEQDDGRPYFVMEYASGGVLARRIPATAGQADVESLRSIVTGLAAGLTALHHAGVVHRDVKPANVLLSSTQAPTSSTVLGTNILRPGERVLIGDLGIAKDIEHYSPDPTILAGTPRFRAPEQTIRGAEITPATDVYGATGVLWNLLTGAEPPDEPSLDLQLASAPVEWRSVLRQGLDPDPDRRFASAAAWGQACTKVLGTTTDGEAQGFRSVLAEDACPYKGLAAFQPDDASLFFGRERLIDELVQRLQANPALIVGGPSGTGKSSLVRAGLLPSLERGVLPGSQHWRVALFTPGTDAMFELAFQLRRLADDASITRDLLADDPDSVRRLLANDSPVLIAIDQFEELFTLNPKQTQTDFVAALDALTGGSHSSVRVILTVRADFYDSCAQHRWLADRINENQVLVGPMGAAELRRAIEGPAQQTGLRIEPGLVDEILRDAGANTGSLPLLAHALMETWIRRRGHQMTLAGYRDAGGVAGAIAQRAEDTYDALPAVDQPRARDLVLQMTTPGDGGPDTRRIVTWEEIADPGAMRPIIDTFVEARLVTSTDQHIELAHETLLRSWPRASHWIDEARDALRSRQRLGAAATDWEVSDHDPDFLLRGSRLDTTLELTDSGGTALTPLSRRFLDASRHARDQQLDAERSERNRRRRNRRIAFTALAVLLIAAVFASVLARRSERAAQQASQDAQRQVTLGLAATAEAKALTDPLFALALATESAARTVPLQPESLGALATARTALAAEQAAPVPLSDPIAVGNVLRLDLTGDGQLLILGDRNGELTFFDVQNREVVQRDQTHNKGIESIHINNDLDLAVTGGADGQILLWDLTARPFEPEVLDTIAGLAVWSALISPDGQIVSALTSDAGVTFYDLPARARLGTRFDSATERDGLRSVFTGDSAELLVGNSRGELIRIDVASASPIEALAPHQSNVWDLELSPTSDYIYSASNDGTVRRVDLATMTVDESFSLGVEDAVVEMRGVEALANGRDIITGAADGHIQRWDAETGALIARSTAAHEDRVIDGAASADGTLYVSLSDDQKIRFWDLATRTRPVGLAILRADTALLGIALSDDGLQAVGTDQGSVLIAGTGSETELDVGEGDVYGLEFGTDGKLFVGDGTGLVTAWDPRTGERIATGEDFHTRRVMDIVASPDGTTIATAGADGLVGIWDTATLRVRHRVDVGSEVNGVAFVADDELVAVDLAGRVTFWSLTGEATRSAFAAGEDVLFAVAVDPASERLAVAGGDEAIAVFDLASGDKVSRLTPLAGGAVDLAFTPSGAVIGLSRDGSVAVWDPVTGSQLGPISPVHADDHDAWRLQLDDDLGVWTVGEDAMLHRLDVLDQRIACAITQSVFDTDRQVRFLADEPLMSCR